MTSNTHIDRFIDVGFDIPLSTRTLFDPATDFQFVIQWADERARRDRERDLPTNDAALFVEKSIASEENRLCIESVSCTFAGRFNQRTSEVPGHETRLAHLVTTSFTA